LQNYLIIKDWVVGAEIAETIRPKNIPEVSSQITRGCGYGGDLNPDALITLINEYACLPVSLGNTRLKSKNTYFTLFV
jgi:hypothetical protein